MAPVRNILIRWVFLFFSVSSAELIEENTFSASTPSANFLSAIKSNLIDPGVFLVLT